MKRIWIIVAALAIATIGLFTWITNRLDPPIETIVSSSLKAVQEQNRLSTFAARFVTDVTSSKTKFMLSAQKTLIIPAMVRYEVDLAKLKQRDLKWDAASKTLTVKAPALELVGPEFDLSQTREYESGMVLMTLTDVEASLDAENRAKAKDDVLKQAKSEPMLKLARSATEHAIAASFALPLRAAGISATVKVESQ